MLPTTLLSGYTFPIDQMPAPIRCGDVFRLCALLRFDPARGLSEGQHNHRTGRADLGLLIFAVAIIWIAGRSFRKSSTSRCSDRLQVMLMKEFLELRRDPWAMFRLVVPLLIQVVVFGYAATFTVNNVATAVLDLDHSQASRSLVSHFAATGRLRDRRHRGDTKSNNRGYRQRPPRWWRSLFCRLRAGPGQRPHGAAAGRPSTAPNSNTALIALGYVSQIVAQFQAETMATAWPTASGIVSPTISVALQERPWFNKGLDDRWFFIPGVIGTLTLIQVISLTSFAVVRERGGGDAGTNHGEPDPTL